MYKKILAHLGKFKKYAILTPLAVTGEVLLELSLPFLMSRIIDVGIANQDISYIFMVGGLMVFLAMLALLFGILAGRFAAVSAMGMAKNLRKNMFHHIQGYAFANIDQFSTPSLITRLTTDVTNLQNAFMMVVRTAMRAPLMIVGASTMVIIINARLSLIVAVALPILAVIMGVISTIAYPRFMRMLKRYDEMNGSVQENLIAIRTVKAFVRGKFESEKFEASAETLRRYQLKAEKLIIFVMPAMQFVMYGSIIAVCWFGGNMIIGGSMQVGAFASFFSYLFQVLMSLIMLSMVFIMIVLSRASITRIVEVLDEVPDITDDQAGQKPLLADGSIHFENVNFSYDGRPDNLHLHDVNLKIAGGETIGIIGGTGSAKTTLVQLIPRLYDVTSGSLQVGGHDVRQYELATLHDEVAMVLQNNVLFSGTIAENLRWGNPNASDEELADACRQADAHDFIMAFPDGYRTDLGQGGVNVSGGQKQRLCIARALLKKPKILILDDSTSAVDTATDSRIRQALRTTLPQTTKLIIAQRIASVMDADRIIVMDEGTIQGVGTHEELLATNEIYREVYDSQQRGVA